MKAGFLGPVIGGVLGPVVQLPPLPEHLAELEAKQLLLLWVVVVQMLLPISE